MIYTPAPAPTLGVQDQLVHATRPEGGADGIGDGPAGVDVGEELALALGGVGPVPKHDDLRLL